MKNLFERYLNYLEAERNVSPYTVRNYKADLLGSHELKGFFPFLSERKLTSLEQVDRQIIRDYLGYLMECGIVRASVARKLSAIRSFFRYLLREGALAENPLEDISQPKLEKRLPSFLSVEEAKRLVEVASTKREYRRDRAILELIYASGIRVSELAGLTLDRIDLESREVRVLGKGSKERVVLMGTPAAEAIAIYLSQERPLLAGTKRSNALFLNRYGKRLSERGVQRILGKYAKIAGITKWVHPHLLRHTFATHMLDGGADLRIVQELLGHASLSSTQIYTHVTQKRARDVYLAAHPLARKKTSEDKQKTS